VNANNQEIAFDLRQVPPTGYTALFLPPEVLANVQNVAGFTPRPRNGRRHQPG